MEQKYKAIVVDDHEGVRDFIVEALHARNFDVTGYGEAEGALGAFDAFALSEQPDLVIVDLQLEKNRMQGIDLVAELADRDISSEILVVSGNLGPTEMWKAMMAGAGAALPKPFDDFRVAVRKMETLAEVGKRRRLHKLTGQLADMDRKRLDRPVFLSYSTKDKRMANGLRRNLESKDISVWYAPTTLEGGQIWRKHIQDGIQNTSIFVALVTANYLESPHCFGELMRFHNRIEAGVQPEPLLLPLLCTSQREVSRNQTFGPILRDFQGIDLTSRFNDALTLLLGRIQSRMEKLADVDTKHPSRADSNLIPPSSSDKIA